MWRPLETFGQSARRDLSMLRRFVEDESGATAIEYGLIAALVAVVIIGAVGELGQRLDQTFSGVSRGLGGEQQDLSSTGR